MNVRSTAAARDVVQQVLATRPEALFVFVFGAGCCEGTAPHLFANHHIGPTNTEVGRVGDVPVYADEHVCGLYADRDLVIDVARDETADGFSAEIELGFRFVLRQ